MSENADTTTAIDGTNVRNNTNTSAAIARNATPTPASAVVWRFSPNADEMTALER